MAMDFFAQCDQAALDVYGDEAIGIEHRELIRGQAFRDGP